MGPTVIRGLPAHILLVHLVLAAVPLAALLLVLYAVWPAARRRIGIMMPIVALGALITVPITTHAGEWLQRRLPNTPSIRHHVALGLQMKYWMMWPSSSWRCWFGGGTSRRGASFRRPPYEWDGGARRGRDRGRRNFGGDRATPCSDRRGRLACRLDRQVQHSTTALAKPGEPGVPKKGHGPHRRIDRP